jgi:phage-related protein
VREIIFYKTPSGDCPVEKFLDALSAKQARKVTWVLQLVETLNFVPIQYFKKLDGTNDIWEVRIDFGSDTFRLLGFFDKGNLVILTNGFAKKTRKTPRSEIGLAEQRMKDYQSRGKTK